jgi:hypothetical protein
VQHADQPGFVSYFVETTTDESLLQGDGMHNSGALLPEMVNNGIRLLLYAGEADMRKSLLTNYR